MSTPEEKAAARRAKILARGDQRMKVLRGEADHVDAVPDSEVRQIIQQHEEEMAAATQVRQKQHEDDVLETVLAQTMKQIDSERQDTMHKDTLTPLPSTPIESTPRTSNVDAPTGSAAVPAPLAAAAPVPKAVPTGPTIVEKMRVVRWTKRVSQVRDVLLVLGPAMLGLLLASLALGCGWLVVSYDGGSVGSLVRLLRPSPSAATRGDGGIEAELLQQAVEKLGGQATVDPSTLSLAFQGASQALKPARLAPPVQLLSLIGAERCDAFSAVLSGSVGSSTAWWAPYLTYLSFPSYALLALMAWQVGVTRAADRLIKAGGGQVQAEGGMLQGLVGMLSGLSGRGSSSASGTLLVYLPSFLAVTTALGAAVRQGTISVMVFVLTVSLYAALGRLRVGSGAGEAEL